MKRIDILFEINIGNINSCIASEFPTYSLGVVINTIWDDVGGRTDEICKYVPAD